MKGKSRILITVLATLAEEIALVVFVLLGLPILGVEIPLGWLITIMSGIAAYGVISYRLGSRALMKKPRAGLSDMVGLRGEVMETLAPKGMIKIGSEFWSARTTGNAIDRGKVVTVIERDGLQLVVNNAGNSKDSDNEYPQL